MALGSFLESNELWDEAFAFGTASDAVIVNLHYLFRLRTNPYFAERLFRAVALFYSVCHAKYGYCTGNLRLTLGVTPFELSIEWIDLRSIPSNVTGDYEGRMSIEGFVELGKNDSKEVYMIAVPQKYIDLVDKNMIAGEIYQLNNETEMCGKL